MKRLLSILLVLLCEAATAQMFDGDYYYPYAEPEERIADPHSGVEQGNCQPCCQENYEILS